MVDKFYFIKGGAETYMFTLSEILEAKGHSVYPFAMRHTSNVPTAFAPYFVDNIDYEIRTPAQKATAFFKVGSRMIYSFHARRQLDRLLEADRPDIAHLHMIDHQISPSILHSLKEHGVPVIQTVHQYKLVCPNYRLYNPRTEKVCEKCLTGRFYHPLIERCHKESLVASALIALESYLHRKTRIYEKHIDIFHVPSRFMGRKMEEAGVGKGRIRHLFYTIKVDQFEPSFEPGDYILYFGRLAREKGIITLLRAMKDAPAAKLKVVGEGPMKQEIERYVAQNGMDNVQLLGVRYGAELAFLIRNARFVVVPSEWYDNSPLVIYESFAYGKPVVGTRMGGIPELIDDEENGLLFDASHVAELSAHISRLWGDRSLALRYGKAARRKAEREFSPDAHYEKVIEWYNELLGGSMALHRAERDMAEVV